MMKVYKAVHERENKCKELHKEMNMNVGPTRLVQPDFYLLQDDLKWYEKPKLTKTEKSFIEALDPSWSYMLRNGKGELYLARKVESMYGSTFKYLYLEGITIAKFDFIEAEDESWLVDDLRKLEVKDEAN